jgi:hypothetical protein
MLDHNLNGPVLDSEEQKANYIYNITWAIKNAREHQVNLEEIANGIQDAFGDHAELTAEINLLTKYI